MSYILEKSHLKNKKMKVTLPDGKTVNFGAEGYSDYTLHKDHDRMLRYLERHKNNENWGKTGISSAGFWARWILWNKPSLSASIKDVEKRFKIKITKRN